MSNNATHETPVAGNNNQPLFYDSGLDKYRHKTAAEARTLLGLVIQRTFLPTLYYTGTGLTGTDTAAALTLSIEYAIRFEVYVPTTFDRIGLEITTAAATSVVRLGIRNDTGSGYPGSLIIDAGTIDASTTGYKEITISQTLGVGRYWLSAADQVAACSVRTRNAPDPFIGQSTTASNNSNCFIQAAAGAFGAFGATPQTAGTAPKILLRAA